MPGWIWIAIIIVAVIATAKMFPAKVCSVCGTAIKRRYYTWTIDGEKKVFCPSCSSQMDRRVSRTAFQKRFGK